MFIILQNPIVTLGRDEANLITHKKWERVGGKVKFEQL